MTDTMTPSPTGQPDPGLLSRIIGVLLSPRDTFAAVVARPRWFGAMAVAVLIISGAQFALLDVFMIWWIVVLAIGLAVLYRTRARVVAASLMAAYVGIAVLLAGTMAVLGRNS